MDVELLIESMSRFLLPDIVNVCPPPTVELVCVLIFVDPSTRKVLLIFIPWVELSSPAK